MKNIEDKSCVTELACVHCGATYSGRSLAVAEGVWMTCPKCGPADGILDVEYDFDRVRAAWNAKPLSGRALNHWRYEELLPLQPTAIRHDWSDGWTPVLDATRLAKHLGLGQILLKDEGRNPTASFKDRASSVGVAHALQVGAKTIACASTGNAASSLAGHAALAGLPAYIFVPATAPEPKVAQLQVFGATVFAVKSSYDAAYDLCSQACQEFGWYNRNCAINPVLVEGKKTAGLEVAEQSASFGGVPDWVAVSVGDGCTIAGIWKGLKQMRELGVIERLPRLLAVQAEHVKPIDYAIEHGRLPPIGDGKTIADSIDVHVPRNWRKAVNAIRESDGVVVTASDDAILDAMRLAGRHGMFAEPAAAASLAAVVSAIDKTIQPTDRVLVMITGSGLKDTKNAIRAGGQPISIEPSVNAVADALRNSRKDAKAQN
ncbi:MAG TPA: threonine synthase [Lacipirellulaceae bacterium]|nr:threonine synthase [Lacipirellulaceae bacterium]